MKLFCKHNYIILTGTNQETQKTTNTENGLYIQKKFVWDVLSNVLNVEK